eukprot:gene32340-39110_t
MNLTRLRSKLSYACPDLQTLTLKDLEEFPWTTKQRLCLALFQDSHLLQEKHQRLQMLIEEKSLTLANWKKLLPNAIKKEEKKEYEHQFRHRFLQIFVEGLEELKWPPALEAFSNPIASLQSDNSVFHNAVDFLVSVIYPASDGIASRHPALEEIPPSSGKKEKRPSSAVETVRGDIVTSSSPRPNHHQPQHIEESMQNISSISEQASYMAPSSAMSRKSSAQSTRVGIGAAEAPKYLTQESRLVQMLQMQNEELTRRLATLERAVEKRQDAEASVGNLIREFRTSLAEVAQLGAEQTQSPKTTAGTSLGTALPMTVRRLHDQVKALEDQWQDASKRARALCADTGNRPKSVGKGSARPGVKLFQTKNVESFGSSPNRDADAEESELLSAGNVHSLTRDLVCLSELASKVVDTQDALQDSPILEHLESMHYMSQNLAMKLSRLAPMLPDNQGDNPSSCIDRLSELLSGQHNKHNHHFVQPAQRYVEDIAKERQTLLRALSQQRRHLKQLVRTAQAVKASSEVKYEKLIKDVMPTCQELSTMSIAVKEICEAAARARKAKVKELAALNTSMDSSSISSTPRLKSAGSAGQNTVGVGVCPWDLLAQGRAGQEVAYLFLTLNTYLPTLTCLAKDLEKLPVQVQRAAREILITNTVNAVDNARLNSLDQLYLMASHDVRSATASSSAVSPKKSPNSRGVGNDTVSPSGSGSKRQAGAVKRSASASNKKLENRPPFEL